jgi:hypothetical protein
MGPWTAAGEGAQEKHRYVHVALISADELVRAALKRQIVMTNAMHQSLHSAQLKRPTGIIRRNRRSPRFFLKVS